MSYKRLRLPMALLGWMLLGGHGLLLSTPSASPLPVDLNLDRLLKNVEDRYNRLKTARLHFQQIYRQGPQTLREETGTLYLRKPGQMRWEYEDPEAKLFLTDGKRLIFYVPMENRVTVTPVKESDDLRTPLRFLLGRLRFDREFEEVQLLEDVPPLEADNVILKAVPKQWGDYLEWVLFEVNPQYEIRRLIANEPGGVQTEFRFTDEERNPPLSSQLFRFQPPEGAEIIQQ
ncbi:MAG: outer membrane lipoprotein carrier protein LolA [Acidobacteria bacterium]|nr:outer membrane lipoprotein carrier protein LolA [Acidobacteriota bacterium]